MVVWGDILVRSWNSPATGTGSSQLSCDGEPVPLGWEGLHVFDISDKTNPVLVGDVEGGTRFTPFARWVSRTGLAPLWLLALAAALAAWRTRGRRPQP